MLEQPSKSKYEHKLRNHLINSLSLTGTDIQLLLRKFWYSYCTQSFVSHSPLKNPIKSFGIFTQRSFACPKLDGNTNNNKDVLHEAAYESHQNRTLKNTKPFNLMPRLWLKTNQHTRYWFLVLQALPTSFQVVAQQPACVIQALTRREPRVFLLSLHWAPTELWLCSA